MQSPHGHPALPNYTTNDMYGCYYDRGRISLETTPERMRNNAIDDRARRFRTTGGEYGSFLTVDATSSPRPPRWYVVPDGKLPEQYVPESRSPRALAVMNQNRLEELRAREPPPPMLPPREEKFSKLELEEVMASLRKSSPPPPPQQQTWRPPPPVKPAPPPPMMKALPPPPAPASAPASAPSPPPPHPASTWRAPPPVNPLLAKSFPVPAPPPLRKTASSPPLILTTRKHPSQPSPPPEPVLRYGDKVIHLPDIDAVELHMHDKSRIILSMKEFYRRHLTD